MRRKFWISIRRAQDCLFSRRNGYTGKIIFGWSVCIRLFSRNLLSILLLTITSTHAQSITKEINDCGIKEILPIHYTEWKSIDTLKNIPTKDTLRSWVYDEERLVIDTYTYAAYCPCCAHEVKFQQYRICQLTGIRQLRYKVQRYHYKPKPKTDYQKTVDSFKN